MNINTRLFKICIDDGIGFFNACDRYSLTWKNLKKHPLLFSERNGYTSHTVIGDWSFKIVRNLRYTTRTAKR